MHLQIRTPLLATALVGALAGCGDSTGVGLPAAFDPAAIEAAVDATLTPLRASRGPRSALLDAFDDLTDRGVSFDGHDLAWTEFPAEILGQTFVYDAQEQAWHADESRTGAPADGVRVLWYDTDAAGSFLIPLDERGYVDLTDEDTDVLSRLGARMVETTAGGDVTLLDFIQGYRIDDATEWSNHAEAAGFYAGADETVDFDLTSDASGSDATGDQESALVVTLDGPDANYTLSVSAAESGATGATAQALIATVRHDGLTTELDLDLTQDGGFQEGTGTISFDGRVVVRVTVEGSSFRYRDADGEAFATGTVIALDNLVRTLFLTGLGAVTTLPLLFP